LKYILSDSYGTVAGTCSAAVIVVQFCTVSQAIFNLFRSIIRSPDSYKLKRMAAPFIFKLAQKRQKLFRAVIHFLQ
jgi:hypothetical protein